MLFDVWPQHKNSNNSSSSIKQRQQKQQQQGSRSNCKDSYDTSTPMSWQSSLMRLLSKLAPWCEWSLVRIPQWTINSLKCISNYMVRASRNQNTPGLIGKWWGRWQVVLVPHSFPSSSDIVHSSCPSSQHRLTYLVNKTALWVDETLCYRMSNLITKTLYDLIRVSPGYHQLFDVTILVLKLHEQDTTFHKLGFELPPLSHVIF